MKNKFLLTKKHLRVGIDIRASVIRFVIAMQHCHEIKVLEHGEYCYQNDFSHELSKIRSHLKCLASCYLTISHRLVMMKTLQFAENFNDQEMHNLFTINSLKYFKQEEVFFDFECIGDQENKVRVIAYRKAPILNWINLFKQKNLALNLITTDVLAIENFLQLNRMLTKNKVYGVFFILGNELLQMIILNFQVYFTNSVDISDKITSCLTQEIFKFFRLYESHNILPQAISDLIVFGSPTTEEINLLKTKLNLDLTCYQSLEEINQHNITDIQYLLPLSLILC